MTTGVGVFDLKLPKGRLLTCLCGRPTCGLKHNPPQVDETDSTYLWLPAGYLNYTLGSDYLMHQGKKAEHEFKTRLEAARAYLSDMLTTQVNRFDHVRKIT